MAVNQFTSRVKVSCMTCGFGYPMEQNGSQVGETPITEELGLVSWLCIEGGVRNDVVGQLDLFAVQGENV